MTKALPVIQYQERTALCFPEETLELEPGQLPLEMVQIPSGSFVMGSPEYELGRQETEELQHVVNISEPFFLAKYPVTQAQWRAVAATPQVERELALHPSRFEGDNRPVERVSWLDVVEFCQRLKQITRRPYRLPSEAEWEYACRAGTTSPFHFGASITTELANYRGVDEYIGITAYSGAYGDGPHGEFREQTTDVGQFKLANAFGLYDMHGNVWEWCQDRLNRSFFEGAPVDSSAWATPPADETEEYRSLRGGSWYYLPQYCQSASRFWDTPDGKDSVIGFRVACCGSAR